MQTAAKGTQKLMTQHLSSTFVDPEKQIMQKNVYRDEKAGPPHEALFFVLPFLPVFELVSMSEVCRSLRDAVKQDPLPWLTITVQRPLNMRLSDEILIKLTSKANAGLRSLALYSCPKVTDDGLHRVISETPLVQKLNLPGCTGLTPEGVIRAVKTLSENKSMRSLQINGICNMTKQHYETLEHYLLKNQHQHQKHRHPVLYHEHRDTTTRGYGYQDHMIDVDICPKCGEVRMVFDCPKEACMNKRNCRGCIICVPRCEECGVCVEEIEEAACVDVLCLDCWMQLPKCSYCNKPYCRRHTHLQRGSISWLCEICDDMSITNVDAAAFDHSARLNL